MDMIAAGRRMAAILLLAWGTAAAEYGAAGSGWAWKLQAGALYQADTALDTGGEFGLERIYLSGSASRMVQGRWRLSMALSYGYEGYDFSGGSGFGGLDPWDKVQEFRASLPLQYIGGEKWRFFAVPSLRLHAETGASTGDGVNGGLLAGAAYRVSDRLTIGPGFGAFSEIEGDPSLFPILLVDWRISDTLSLETGRGFAASRGPGLQLRWRHSPDWQFSLGARYEKTRFRLDDEGPAPGGVGETRSLPLFATARRRLTDDVALTLVGGAGLDERLRLEDAQGRRVAESDASTAPFVGATLEIDL